MKVSSGNIVGTNWRALRFVGMLLLVLSFSIPALSQNTKGDRPKSSREGRFKTQKKDRKGPGFSSKRIKSQGRSPSSSGGQYTPRRSGRGGERAGRSLRPNYNVKNPSEKQRAWKGDITGRRVRSKNQSSTSTKSNVHPQRGRNFKRTVPDREGRQNVQSGRPVRIPSATGKTKNVFSQKGPYIHNPSRIPRQNQKPVSNKSQLARLKTLETKKPPPGKKVRVVPRSASRPYIRNKSINVYANFHRPKKKGERATTRDLAGRPLRTKNYQTPPIGVIKAPRSNTGRKHSGERPYSGLSGSYKSISNRGGRAWVGDISRRNIRSKSGKQSFAASDKYSRNRSATRTGRVGFGGGHKSATKGGRVGTPIFVKAPGIGAQGIGNYRGNRRGIRGFLNQGEQYSGAMKSRRGARGGGSVSGKSWNNNGSAVPVRGGRVNTSGIPGKMKLFQSRPGFRNQGENYSGALKGQRPLKGGGSASGKLWNNNGSAVPTKTGKVNTSGFPGKMKVFQNRPGFRNQGENYSGAIKGQRPLKGGGSVSGKLWNNRETPLPGKPRSERGYNFSGNIKTKRPLKGGGSVSGKLWNNDEAPIPGKSYPSDSRKVSGFPGKMRRFENSPGFNDQGEEFTGYIKMSRLKRNYVQNENASKESLKKKKPAKEVYGVEGLQVKVKRRAYVRNKNISEESLLKLKTTETDESVGGLQVRVKQYNYRQNPSSADGSLKVREPGKAFARATDYQGNIKMQKYRLFERNRGLHPDAKFVKTNKNNVNGERDSLTNFKLWWARLFKKQENQPDHLKEKLKKPRYDKGEQGMWYD